MCEGQTLNIQLVLATMGLTIHIPLAVPAVGITLHAPLAVIAVGLPLLCTTYYLYFVQLKKLKVIKKTEYSNLSECSMRTEDRRRSIVANLHCRGISWLIVAEYGIWR